MSTKFGKKIIWIIIFLIGIFFVWFLLGYIISYNYEIINSIEDDSYIMKPSGGSNCFGKKCVLKTRLHYADFLDSNLVTKIIEQYGQGDKIFEISPELFGYSCFPLDGVPCDSLYYRAIDHNSNDSIVYIIDYYYDKLVHKAFAIDSTTIDVVYCKDNVDDIKDSIDLESFLDACDGISGVVRKVPIYLNFSNKTVYQTGELKSGVLLKNGKMITPYFEYYKDGRLKHRLPYYNLNGTRYWQGKDSSGTETSWFHNGRIKEIIVWRNGESILKKVHIKTGILQYISSEKYFISYSANGYVLSKTDFYSSFPEKITIRENFHKDGFLRSTEFSRVGLFDYSRVWRIYYPNGMLKRETVFRGILNPLVAIIGDKPDYVKEFDFHGRLIRTITSFEGGDYVGISWKKELFGR